MSIFGKKLKADQDAIIKARLEAERQATTKKIAEAVNAERVRHFQQTVALTATVEDLKRRLEKRRPQDLGDEGEIAVLDVLQQTFNEDEFTRIAKGVSGGDIVQRIMHNGTVAGSVVYDLKNTKTFQSKWVPKLKHDQIAANCDHAVLVTTAFKSGHQHLMFTEGVLIVSPARVIEIAKWLRAQVIRTHSLRLSGEDKNSKSQRLYEFMCSDKVADRWDRMAQTITRMRDALRSERIGHERSWNDRADQIEIIRGIRDSFVEDLDAIFEATEVNREVAK